MAPGAGQSRFCQTMSTTTHQFIVPVREGFVAEEGVDDRRKLQNKAEVIDANIYRTMT
jgi:hypothetical protein